MIYSGIVGYMEVEYWQLTEKSYIKNITIMHGMLGFVISLLLVFRTNTAYDRWWEGRKMWGGLVNNSRNFALKLAVIVKDEKERQYFKKMIPTYAAVLHQHLSNDETSLQLFDNVDLEIDHHLHQPNQVAKKMFQKVASVNGKMVWYLHKEFRDQDMLYLGIEFQNEISLPESITIQGKVKA